MKILLLGNDNGWNLEYSYMSALKDLGHEVSQFDINTSLKKYIKFGRFGNILSNFIPIDPWIKKANRDFVVHFRKHNPDILFVFCNVKVSYGALAYIKSISNTKIVLIWPDTLTNIQQDIINNYRLFDMVACYSQTSVKSFELLGFKNVRWVPLAGDSVMFGGDFNIEQDLYCDISFIGGCRPEREAAMLEIVENFPDKKIKIFSVDWKTHGKHKELLKYLDKRLFYGRDFAKVLKSSKVNINIIDDTNYPAANMRFFEIPMAGALQVASHCPEMESIFKHRESILYHHNHTEMIDNIQFALGNTEEAEKIITNAFRLVNEKHTYIKRAEQIINEIGLIRE